MGMIKNGKQFFYQCIRFWPNVRILFTSMSHVYDVEADIRFFR